MAAKRHDRALLKALFVLVAVLYTCVFPYMAWVNNPNENARVYMTMALVEHGTFRTDAIVERHGWTNDMAAISPDGPDAPLHFRSSKAHRYSVKAPAVSYAGVPVYWAFTKIAPIFGHPVPDATSPAAERATWLRDATFVLRLFVIQLPSLGFLVAFERYLRSFSADVLLRASAVLAVALGTNYLAYSLMFVSHALCGAAAFTAFALTERERRTRRAARDRRAGVGFAAGFFVGLTPLFEYHAFPLAAVLGLYALATFWRPKTLFAFALGGAIDASLLMLFQWRSFGSPFKPGHSMVEDPGLAQRHQDGVYGVSSPNWDALSQLSFSKTFGFFGTSPYLWLGLGAILFGLVFARGTRRERRHGRAANLAWMTAMLVFFLTASAASVWRGGWTIGPRLLGAAPPFFAFGALVTLEGFARKGRWRRATARGVAGGLAIASAVTIGLVALVYNTPRSRSPGRSRRSRSVPPRGLRPLPPGALDRSIRRRSTTPSSRWASQRRSSSSRSGAARTAGRPTGTASPSPRGRVPRSVGRVQRSRSARRRRRLHGHAQPLAAVGAGGPRSHRGDAPGREPLRAKGSCLWYQVADLERVVRWDTQAAQTSAARRCRGAECPEP